MDFARREGESERAYFHRVLQEVKYAVDRPKASAVEAYQRGKLTIKELEESLVEQFSKPKKADPAPEKAPEAVSNNSDPSV